MSEIQAAAKIEAERAHDAEVAEAMFDAYNGEFPNPWKTFDGRPVPRWNELNDQVRGKWIAAARRARELLGAKT